MAVRLVQQYTTLLSSIPRSGETTLLRELELVSQSEALEQAAPAVCGAPWPAAPEQQPSPLDVKLVEQATRTPDAVAVVDGDITLTYAELVSRADALAAVLRGSCGVANGEMVGVYTARSARMVVAMLGVMMSGGAYVPLDPEHPVKRIADVLKTTKMRTVVTGPDDWVGAVADIDTVVPVLLVGEWISVDDTAGNRSAADTAAWEEPASARDASAVAAVLFTSGTTGKPKGVEILHRAIVSLIDWMTSEFSLDASVRYLQSTTCTFDLSLPEIFLPLTCGGRTVLARPGGLAEMDYLAGLITTSKITVVGMVPSMLAMLLEEHRVPHTVQHVFACGETLAPHVCRAFFNAATPSTKLWNLYGPTESAIYSHCTEVTVADVEERAISIGRPIAGRQSFVLDDSGQMVPWGAIGQLHIAGIGLSRGYCGSSDLTADTPLMEAGVDSLAATELSGRLQSELGVRLSRTLLFEHPSASAICEKCLQTTASLSGCAAFAAVLIRPAMSPCAACGVEWVEE